MSVINAEQNYQHPPLFQWIQSFGFQTILDIGANTGQFARQFRYLFPDTQIYSFEPIPACFDELQSNFSDDLAFQAFCCALGNENGFADITNNLYSPTSSILPMLEVCKENFPVVQELDKIRVPLKKLDDFQEQIQLKAPLLMKIDVQGFEDRVIAGGLQTLSKAQMLIIEMSFVQLYENAILFDELHSMLRSLGLQYRGNFETIHSMTTGEILQADGIFVRIDA